MSRRLAAMLFATLGSACSSSSAEGGGLDAPAPSSITPSNGSEAVAYFAGGCFWGVEHFLEKLEGVHGVESGYMGGHIENPSYADVVGHQTGHLETVRVRYDRAKVTYEAIAHRFFEIHDPTQANGQGPDIGPQYLSAVFVASDEERATVERLISVLKQRGYAVVTEIKPLAPFYEAEDYHQDYYVRHDKTPYCHAPVDRFGDGA